MACKSCGSTSRATPYPGPRCATCHRAVVKERKARTHDKRVQAVYGLGPGEYEAQKAFQGGVCAICLRATGRTKALAVDHDHKTGEVRGLLCGPCNQMLGHLRDDVVMAERIVQYLRNPPSRVRRGSL